MGSSYKVREGDTLSKVANKLGVSQKALLEANDLQSGRRLKVGKVLHVPTASASHSKHSLSKIVAVHRSTGSYVVRNGENDWTIAHRFGLTVPELHRMNADVKWSALKIGTKLNVPGHHSGEVVASKSSSSKKLVASKTYKVKEGDNDWIIAKRVGTTPKVLRQLNPSVNWNAVHIGSTIRVPGSTLVAKNSTPSIHSRHAIIKGDNVTLRRAPSTSAEKVTSVDSGTPVTVLDHDGSWYKLRFPRGTEAWVRGDFLTAVQPQKVARNEKSHHSTRVASRTDVSTMSRRPRTGNRRAAAGRVAMNLPTTGNGVLDTARGFLGTPYSYGSASRGATDCSGFVGQVYRAHGVKLPRTSIEQSRSGQGVSRSSLKPGDLVFFRTRGGSRINHVGIYVGNGKFIHASSGGGKVQVNSLADGYYRDRFAAARRVAKTKAPSHVVAKKVSKPKADAVAPKAEDAKPEVPAATSPDTAGK